MRLKDPYYLLLILTWIPLIWIYIRRERGARPTVRFPDLSIVKKLPVTPWVRLRHLPFALRLAAIGLLAVALARPQQGQTEEEVSAEGVDIMLVLDVSSTMMGLDFQPKDRLFVAKETIKEFIAKRPSDRMGLVIFAGRAYTKCPLTLDHTVLKSFVDDVDFGQIEDGTAIGTAIATAANRLRLSPAKSKVIVLATDGDNNRGEIDPLVAAKAAGTLGMRIYAIGVGREGQVPYPAQNPFTGQMVVQNYPSTLNEQALIDIASAANGRFFRAQNSEKLKEIYSTIDKLEKTEIKTKSYTTYADRLYPWLLWGSLALLIELILANTRLRRVP